MRRPSLLAAASALTLLSAVAAEAQEVLQLGRNAQGDLAAVAEGEARYTLTLADGQRVMVEARSDAFDTFIEVRRAGVDEVLASDDDGLGEGTNSRLRFTADEAGDYELRLRSIDSEAGAYTVTARALPSPGPAPRPGRIRPGRSVRGELADRDPETSDGLPYDAYVWRASEGERRLITLESDAFDPVVRIGRQDDARGFDELAVNDDGGDGGLGSRLVFTAPDAGDYVIRVTPVDGSGRGDYRLALADAPPAPQARPIEVGGSAEGQLSGEPARYVFRGRADQRVRIDLSSDDFDTVVALLDGNESALAEDDDGAGEGTNSRLTHTLRRDGDLLVEVKAFGDGSGAYRLSLTEVAAEPAPVALAYGQTIQGEIADGAATDGEGRGFVDYVFAGQGGQRVQAVMRSGDFDTYLQIGKGGEEFAALGQDDDGLGEGTDSRLNFTLPDDGDYVVRASPLGSDGKGLFSVELVDRGPQPMPGSMLVGVTARGTLTETDATADDNSFYDAYRVTLQEGEKLRLTMVSNEVDSFVTVGRVDDEGGYEALGSDDDGLSDTHAKLDWTAPTSGEYEIRAGTFQQGQTGAYALNVEKRN